MPREATAPAAVRPSDPTRLVVDGGLLDCRVVPWDTAIFGSPVAEIVRLELPDTGSARAGRPDAAASAAALFRSFDGWCAERGVGLASCRLDDRRLRESMALEDHGFRFVEMVYRPRLDGLERVVAPGRPLDVAPMELGDLERVEAIASSAFSTGRFLLDPRLPPEFSRRRYAAWVRTSAEDPARVVLTGQLDRALVGFFIVERQPDGGMYWHLTAIDPGHQGRGVGLDLWRTMLLRHRAEGVTSVATTISAHNVAALNLYARLGFTFGEPKMTFHRVVAAG